MNKVLSTIGYQGPNILLVAIIIIFLYNHINNPYLYLAVIVWQITSHLINVIIKNTLRLPRPDSEPTEFAKIKKSVNFKNYLIVHREFGMPSGHAQATVSELTFLALIVNYLNLTPLITAAALVQTLITLWQRYTTKRHSAMQLLAGSLIGIMVGVAFYVTVIKYFTMP
jgi:membrane-associated phospholipid phosphatase